MTNTRPPLWKQLIGALGGGALALALYAGYTVAKPELHSLTGLLVLPQSRIDSDAIGDVRVARADVSEREMKRIASRAQRIAADFSGNYNAAAPVVEEPIAPIAPIEMIPMAEEDEAEIAAVQAEMEAMLEDESDHAEAWDDQDMQALMQYDEEKFYGNTEALPDSGIGAWLATLVAFAGAGIALVRRKCAPVHQHA
jgi:hypothetical protein